MTHPLPTATDPPKTAEETKFKLSFHTQSREPGFAEKHPALHFLVEFGKHVGLIVAVDLIVRGFTLWLKYIDPLLPHLDPPKDLTPYVEVSVTRVIVTVMDAVAILLSVLLGIVTLVKIAKEYWRSLL